MMKLFNKILVPLYPDSNTNFVMEKSVALANRFSCDLHLLFISPDTIKLPYFKNVFHRSPVSRQQETTINNRPVTIKEKYAPLLTNGLQVTTSVLHGKSFPVLKELIIREHIELVFIPCETKAVLHTMCNRIDIHRLSTQTSCPVLVVTKTFDANALRQIVVPVDELLPLPKLAMATFLLRNVPGTIHLAGCRHGAPGIDDQQQHYLHSAGLLLKNYSNIKISYTLHDQPGKHPAAMAYANRIKADLVLVDSGSALPGSIWWKRILRRFLFLEPDTPVMILAAA